MSRWSPDRVYLYKSGCLLQWESSEEGTAVLNSVVFFCGEMERCNGLIGEGVDMGLIRKGVGCNRDLMRQFWAK